MSSLNFFLLSCAFSQDVKNRRNPRLVPYVLLDERTKKSNKDSLREAVRTLLGYGYNLEAPDQDHGTKPTLHPTTLFKGSSLLMIFMGKMTTSIIQRMIEMMSTVYPSDC